MELTSNDILEYILRDKMPNNMTSRQLNIKVSCNVRYKYAFKLKKIIKNLREIDKNLIKIDKNIEHLNFYVSKMDDNIKEELITNFLQYINKEKSVLERYEKLLKQIKKD